MTIEFLLDDMSDKDKKRIKEIIKTIRKRSTKPASRESLFLRNFTLALMKKYKIAPLLKKSSFPQLKVSINQIMKQQFEAPMPLDFKDKISQAPEPLSFQDTTPEPLEIKEIIPEPLSLEENIPEPLEMENHLEVPSPIDTDSLDIPSPKKLRVPDQNSVNEAIKRELKAPMPN